VHSQNSYLGAISDIPETDGAIHAAGDQRAAVTTKQYLRITTGPDESSNWGAAGHIPQVDLITATERKGAAIGGKSYG
jgi:hypothetical protein